MIWLLRVVCVVCLVGLGTMTHARAFAWQSDETLWGAAVETTPLKPRPRINLGRVLAARGDYEGGRREFVAAYQLSFDERRSQYQREFSRSVAQTNLAHVFVRTGKIDAAMETLDRVLLEWPTLPQALYNRAAIYAARGECLKSETDYALALTQLPGLVKPPCSAP